MLDFAPSEIVALHGDRFTEPPGRFTVTTTLLTGDTQVRRDPLAEAVLRAAFLGLERDGHLTLEHTRPKALFGLVKRNAVMAELVGPPRDSVGRVENALLDTLRKAGKPLEVDQVVYRWLAVDRPSPHADVLDEVAIGLRDRGLVDETVEEGKVLFMKTRTVRHALAESAREAVAAADVASVQRLLDEADARGELGPRLTKEVQQGFANRTESTDDGPDID